MYWHLSHKLYEGNKNDYTWFTGIIDELVTRYKLLAKYCEDITIIYDKGNTSKKNQAKVDASSYHFIGSLKLGEFSRLAALETASKEFTPLDNKRLESVTAYRTTEVAFGKKRTVVVTFSRSFYEKQNKTLLREIKKCNTNLRELRIKLQKRLDARAIGKSLPGTPPTYKSVEGQVKTIVKPQYMKELFDVSILEHGGLVRLGYDFLSEKFIQIQKTCLGKTILFTDQDTWSTTDIILGYRGQYRIEAAFKITKRGHFTAWQPNFHWTDQKLHIHAFYCVLSLLFISLAHRQVWQAGIEIGLPTLEKELKSIRGVLTLQVPPSGKLQKARFYRTLRKMTEQQRAIYEALELSRVAPN